MKNIRMFWICVTVLCSLHAGAQSVKEYVFPQKVRPVKIDRYAFTGYYHNGPRVYNLKQAEMTRAKGDVLSMKISPSGSSYAVLSEKDGKKHLRVYDLWHSSTLVKDLYAKNLSSPEAICYSPDARFLAVWENSGDIVLYETSHYSETGRWYIPGVVSSMIISGNGYYLATFSGSEVCVYDMKTGAHRFDNEMQSLVNSIAFSPDGKYMMVTTANGLVHLYDTGSFIKINEFDSNGMASDCDFHPDGKWLGVIKDEKTIVLINRYDGQDREYIRNDSGGITDICFVKDGNDDVFVLYNTMSTMSYRQAGELAPNYTNLLSEELDHRMDDWMKQMEGESLEDYRLRVNEESRMEQIRLFEQQIATEMADGLLEMSEISLGGYNQETKILALDFNTMPTIYLDVPEDKVQDFMDMPKLDFRNPLYGITPEDKFELVYLEVYNKETGASAVFDNRERRSLEHLKNDASFIPLDIIEMSNMEEIRLEEIKNEVVSVAKSGNVISDHTEITVNTGVYSSVDPSGKKILNYRVGFSYDVEASFSAVEDFAPGKYNLKHSGAAQSMIGIITKAFENDFAQYVKPGRKVKVKITGMADHLRIAKAIPYDGEYGNYINEPVYGKEMFAVTLTDDTEITTNEQLAFIRAAGVKCEMEKKVTSLAEMDAEYEYHVKVLDKVGGAYRRISVEFNFIDAF